MIYFQPGGLDIPSVIGSGTALLSSLLAGEENFGKVLGNYVGKWLKLSIEIISLTFYLIIGTAIDGFSGGGGAVMIKNLKSFKQLSNLPKFEKYVSHMTQVFMKESFNYFQANNGQFFGQFIGKFISSLSAVN